jgi:hypothetical protein
MLHKVFHMWDFPSLSTLQDPFLHTRKGPVDHPVYGKSFLSERLQIWRRCEISKLTLEKFKAHKQDLFLNNKLPGVVTVLIHT